ncbi:MAG: CusA/CzcA family heavy metal efflux RND transporter [Kiritimatiellae bacterium]|nr:CusA/CzcA family heavy metal efflux RND transporter [Kiritimatiellia bacterium]MDD5520187.1 CusA/CzcA family heavy metal efflux RND transporter [Kiritimatiellia bacterium]
MLNTLINFILKQRLLVCVLFVMLSVVGVIAWKTLPIDAFPDVTNVQVMILAEAPGLAAIDVEQRVTFPMELAMQGLPRVIQMRSMSKSGLAQVVVVFEDGVDIYFARQLIFERLQNAKGELPEGVEPELGPISTGLGEIYQYTLESEKLSPLELRTIQDWVVAPQLRSISGVNEVNSFGGFLKQYHVVVDPNRLLKYKLTLQDILSGLEKNNANAGGNIITKGWEQAYVRSVGMIQGIPDIENIVLHAKDGTPVFLKDVAEVKIGSQTRQGAVTKDGQGEAVAGMVIMLRGSNSKIVVDAVKKAIPRIQASLPKGVNINCFYDRTALIQACIKTVADALRDGAIFVIIILFLLLGNFRGALIVALSLPLTAFITFILMGWQGVTANLMSLGGLAIAIGMVVDASIVVTENIARHLTEKNNSTTPRSVIVLEAVIEVARPVIFAILIIIIVFLPLFTLEQMEGKMFRPLATTMCFALLGSLIVALTIVPVLCSLFLRGHKTTEDNVSIRFLKRGYLPVLSWALEHRRATIITAIIVFAATMTLMPRLGTEFLPQLDEGAIAVNCVRLPSASLEGSVAVGTAIEQRLRKFPEVMTVVTKTGRAEISEDPMGPEQNDVVIMLHPEKEWKTGRTKEALVTAIKEEMSVIPGLRLSFSQPIALRVNELISGVKSDLAVKLFGPDLDVIKPDADRIASIIRGIRGAEDVKVEQISGAAQVEVVVDRQAIARYKINLSDVNEVIETAIGGKMATTVVEGQMRFAVVVRYPEKDRADIKALERILVPSPEGVQVPLGQLAKIREVEGPSQISREKGMRRVVVECNIRGRDMGTFVAEVRRNIRAVEAKLPPGYFIDYGGQFENQQRAMKRLGIVVPISVVLIFLMLFSGLGSMRSALMVFANLPFALVGGILAVFLLKINISVPAVIGFIALFGTAVGNGIVLVAFFNQLRQQGVSVIESVRRGCDLRFRPLLMTALAMLLGLVPMLYATGNGSEIQRPLASVVLGGLISSLFLTLIVLPVIYAIVESKFEGHGNS